MNEPAGIVKCGPRCLSIVRAWSIVRLLEIPIGVLRKMPVDHSGMIFIRVLRSFTSLTVHNFHVFSYEPSNCLSSSVFSAARFKNLQINIVCYFIYTQNMGEMQLRELHRERERVLIHILL